MSINFSVAFRLEAWLLLAMIAFVGSSPSHSLAADVEQVPTVLITGSNRGIGFEFVRQYAVKGWHVIATCRRPQEADALQALSADYPNITIEELDVLRHDMIDALAKKYRKQPIDVLLSNAGFFGDTLQIVGQFYGRLDYSLLDRYIWTNAVGPLKMSEAFFDHVAASKQKKMMSLSSLEGSIQGNLSPGQFWYSASKVSQNIFMTKVAGLPKFKRAGIIVGMFSPGLIIRDYTRNLNVPDKVEVEVSVAGMIEVIENFTPEMSGSFVKYNGAIVPW